jgi:fatty acid synthase subunit beta
VLFLLFLIDAGYHVKLVSGRQYSAVVLCAKVTEIQSEIPAGMGITLDFFNIDPCQFRFQFLLQQVTQKEGLHIQGFFVVAGIPTTEKAVEMVVSHGPSPFMMLLTYGAH